MAEQDNLEPIEDIETDEVETDVDSEPLTLLDRLKDRRTQLIIGGVVGALILIGVIWGVFLKPKPQTGLTNRAALEATLNQEKLAKEIAKKKTEKKSKKKKVKYISLYKQLDRRQLSQILRELSYNDILFKVEQTGKQFEVLVDEELLEDAKRILAIKGLPSGSAKGFEIFDEASNLGVTEFDKRIRLIRALSGELERSIMELNAVDMAKVEIVIPEPRLFAVTQPPVTASILLRKKIDAMISDDIVFSIIQLASNSVENLQPENISVVDTNGRLLSNGIIERMAEQQRQEQMSARYDAQGNLVATPGSGKVVVPTVDDIVDWFEVKNSYEKLLETKANGQLIGVLPEGSYKVAITIDMKSLKQNASPEIRRINASIVIDSSRKDIVLDEFTRSQIRNAISGAIGFVEGRDELVLSRASFVNATAPEVESLEETAEVEPEVDKVVQKKPSIIRFIKLWPLLLMGGITLSLCILVYNLLKSVARLFFKEKETINADEDVDILPSESFSEMEIENESVLSESSQVYVEELKSLALEDPQVIADQIEKWMVEELVANE